MPVDVPLLGARGVVWIVAELHLFLAAFILGAPIFIVVCEWLGLRTRDARYERLAKETMKAVTLAYSLTAISGGAFLIALAGPYQRFTGRLLALFGPVFGLYAALIVVETLVMYVYWYSWEPLARRKGAHIAIGVALNVVGTVVMLLMNAVGAFMLTPPPDLTAAGLWDLVNSASWSGLNLHRFIANVTFGGFMVALFAAIMFLTARSDEDRAFYDWMGFTGNFIGVATLMALPLAGYVLAKELFLYDATIATFMMADKLSWFFVLQGLLVSLLFLGANMYMWSSIQRIEGGERFLPLMRTAFVVMLVATTVWVTPQNFLADLTASPPPGVQVAEIVIPERAAFLGLMMAKALAVTAIILFTFLTYMLYRRAIATGRIVWGRIPARAQYALVFVPAVAVYTMGLMGAIRELARQDWHVYRAIRDTTPYWYTPSLGHTALMTGVVTILFFLLMAFIFWVGFKLGAARSA